MNIDQRIIIIWNQENPEKERSIIVGIISIRFEMVLPLSSRWIIERQRNLEVKDPR